MNPESLKPQEFGSGCLVRYLDRTFFVTVSHVVKDEKLVTCLETDLPGDSTGQHLATIDGICTFEMLKLDKNQKIDNEDDFDKFFKTGKKLDIAFAEIKNPIQLLQLERDFGTFQIAAGPKLPLMLDGAAEPCKEDYFGFYGKIRHEYLGKVLKMEDAFKYDLKFHGVRKDLYMFLVPEIITDKEGYEGCSGAPILNSEGRLVAFECLVQTPSKIVYGIPVQKFKELLDYALKIGIL